MKIFELEIPKIKYSRLFKDLVHQLKTDSGDSAQMLCTPNPEICLQTLEDKNFLKILQKSDYLTSDGIGLYVAYQIQDSSHGKIMNFLHFPVYFFNILFRKEYLYQKYGDRICWSDLTDDLVNFCEQKGIHIAILDPYYPKDKEKCESQKYFHTNLQIAFPYLHFEMYVYSEEKKDKIFKKIADSKAKVLFSTLGMKSQEISIIEVLKACPNIRLGLGVGSSFDYFIGFQKRAPYFLRKSGLEWLYRIFTSPSKLKRIGRIYQAVIVFPMKVLLHK